MQKKIKNDKFTLEDFLEQFQQVKKLGSMEEILGMMPGVDASKLKDAKIDQKATARVEAIIRSMTPRERRNPELLNASRKKRIAAGSGKIGILCSWHIVFFSQQWYSVIVVICTKTLRQEESL